MRCESLTVGNQIDPRYLLHELAADAKHGAVEEHLLSVFEKSTESRSAGSCSFFVDGTLDFFQFLGQERFVLGDRFRIPLYGP